MKTLEQYTDTQLIDKILAGETALFEILIRRNNPFLYKTGRSYNYGHEDTQDLMQETFIDAYLHLASFENRSSFKTWIVKIMFRNCYGKSRLAAYKNETRKEIAEGAIPLFANLNMDTNRTVMNRELNAVIERAMLELPIEYRMVFSLREVNGLSVKETAEVMDLSETNVKARLSRAKAMLRKAVEKSYKAEEIFEFNLIYCDAIVNEVMQKIGELKS